MKVLSFGQQGTVCLGARQIGTSPELEAEHLPLI